MKKSIWIFLLAVLLPSVVLGWLALRSAEEQQIILEKRTAELYQKETENAAGAVRALVDGERRAFTEAVGKVVASGNAEEASRDFSAKLAKAWPRKAVGFALGKDGRLVSPTSQKARNNAELQKFLLENSAFLCSTMPATVYWVSGDELSRPEVLRRKSGNDGYVLKSNGGNGGEQTLQMAQNSKAAFQKSELPAMTANSVSPPRDELRESPKAGATSELAKDTNAPDAPAPVPAAPAAIAPEPSAPKPTEAMPSAPGAPATKAAMPGAPTSQADPDFSDPIASAEPAPATATRAIHGMKARHPLQNPGGAAGAALEKSQAGSARSAPGPASAAAAAPSPATTTAFRATKALEEKKSDLQGSVTVDKVAPSPSVVSDAKFNDLEKTMKQSAADASKEQRLTIQPAQDPQFQSKVISKTGQGELVLLQGENAFQGAIRNVAPQRMPDGDNNTVLSQVTPSTAEFKTLTSEGRDGVITRFVQDQLDIIFWVRPVQDPEMIFGCLIASENLADLWPLALPAPDASNYERFSRTGPSEFALALLDDKARPVATQPPHDTGRDWKRPFVASEVGEALPHWEAALYLHRPEQLRESARALRRTLTFLVALALGAIACGGWLVVADARRQLALAQQKTDFVSNVSHELKTPLTSIRMFAELMQNGRAGSESKHPQYLRIIMVEAERLTRLINNVLDFARIERRQKRIDKKPFDLHSVIERTWEGHELHLRESGFTTRWQASPPPYPVVGDEDALAQVLVNLLSNAEKYAGERKEVELHTYIDGTRICVSVLDRGIGVPAGEERKIFEAFYRAHDSLSSGIQGSGLGLTLAQRLAREHGGEILYQAREDGGSNFTLRLPMAPQSSSAGTVSL